MVKLFSSVEHFVDDCAEMSYNYGIKVNKGEYERLF